MQAPAGDPHYSGQLIRTQNSQGGRLSAAASERKAAFHTHLFVLANSSRTLVRPHRTRGDRTRNLHFSERSGSQAHALHPCVLNSGKTVFLETATSSAESMPKKSVRRPTS